MGLSSNQARFLSLTSRQVDLEQRVQQICQRRLRLSSELEKVATHYNDSISNRKMFTSNPINTGISDLSVANLKTLGYKVVENISNKPIGNNFMKKINQMSESDAVAAGFITIHDATELSTLINADLTGKYMLMGDIDMSSLGTLTSSLINGTFTGTFDGNGYTVNNMKIDTQGAVTSNIGLFAKTENATIKNIGIKNADINAINSSNVGLLVGYNGKNADNSVVSTIENCYTTGNISGEYWTGGIAGVNVGGSIISDCFSNANVQNEQQGAGGIVGANCNGDASVSNCYSTGDIQSWMLAGGIAGVNRNGDCLIENCYSTSNVTGTRSSNTMVGGIVGQNTIPGNAQIINCYAANGTISGAAITGGIIGYNDNGSASASCFYLNNQTTDPGGASSTINTTGWDPSVWDLTGTLPTLKTDTNDLSPSDLEEGLRSGKYSLAQKADEFTQDPFTIEDESYEKIDWRTAPELNDELSKSDDADAESKYDKTTSEINAQDKKLQLEQSSIEVEYKAVSSEKEAVKKILETNSQVSFKYFG